MTIDFFVENQVLKCISDYRAAEGTENYIQCRFKFSEDWNGFKKSALMICKDMEKPAVVWLDENDCCFIPHGFSGICNLSVAGSDGNVTITTGIAAITLEKTLPPGEVLNADNPQSDFSVLLKAMDDFGEQLRNEVEEKISDTADKAALEEIRSELGSKVDKISGKGLSSYDFNYTYKSKLDGIAKGAQKNTVTSVAGKTGAVALGKADVGLGNADNTSDADKPISNAVAAALAEKASIAEVYTKTEVDNAISAAIAAYAAGTDDSV